MDNETRDWLLWLGKVFFLEPVVGLGLCFLLSGLSEWRVLWLSGGSLLLVLWFMLATAGRKRPTLGSALRAVVARRRKVPNRSIEPTATGVPASAPHVKR
jgi:uncharacterized RDD family membrane protein YckC